MVLREKVETLQRERDEAVFKTTQYQVRHGESPRAYKSPRAISTARSQKDEELILLLAENAQRNFR